MEAETLLGVAAGLEAQEQGPVYGSASGLRTTPSRTAVTVLEYNARGKRLSDAGIAF